MFRKMRRFKQALDGARCADVLKNGSRGILAVNGDDGYPYTIPLNYVYDGGRIYFHSAVEGHKADAIQRDGRASFCVLEQLELSEDGWSYFFDSVVAFGRVSVVEDEAERIGKLRLLGQKYFPDVQMVESDISKNAHRALVLCLEIEHLSGKHVHER